MRQGMVDRLGSGRAYLARFPLAGRKPRKQARGAAERSLNGFVADQACAVGAILQHELPGVKCLELRAMADADYGCFGEPLQEESHQFFLAQWIERGGGFIHYDNFGTLDQRARKRKPLFFSAGEHVFPSLICIESIEKMAQTNLLDSRTDHGVVDLLGRQRIGRGPAQRSKRYVRLI